MKIFVSLILASALLMGGSPKTKIPAPTVESVKAMSMFDLINGISDTEALMLENAHDSVSGTISALIRIHEKRIPKLEADIAQADECVRESYFYPLGSQYNSQEDRDRYEKFQIDSNAKLKACTDLIESLQKMQKKLLLSKKK